MISNNNTSSGRRKGTRLRASRVGPTGLQKRQKIQTQERLIQAARDVFASRSYATTSVDAIVSRAGVSRTSFYRHFESKWDIATKLFEDFMPVVYTHWERLASFESWSEEQISNWLVQIMEHFASYRPLIATMREADAAEPQSTTAITDTHEGIIKLLGERIPAFNAALESSERGEEACIRAHLLLRQFDEFIYLLTVRDWDVNRDLAVRIMAGQFCAFINREAAKRPARSRKR